MQDHIGENADSVVATAQCLTLPQRLAPIQDAALADLLVAPHTEVINALANKLAGVFDFARGMGQMRDFKMKAAPIFGCSGCV
jgi:hypothetical protein